MPEPRKQLKLEQLLEFKKAEKPDADFWNQFQAEFRQKQLQTIIVKESFWSKVSRKILAPSSILVPGSTAAVAIFVLVANFRETGSVQPNYSELTSLSASTIQVADSSNVVEQSIVAEVSVVETVADTPASFVMDVIPASDLEAATYTREFPTSTIRSASSLAKASYASYTLTRDAGSLAMTSGASSFGF